MVSLRYLPSLAAGRGLPPRGPSGIKRRAEVPLEAARGPVVLRAACSVCSAAEGAS